MKRDQSHLPHAHAHTKGEGGSCTLKTSIQIEISIIKKMTSPLDSASAFIGTPASFAINPSTENTTNPAYSAVNASTIQTTRVSLENK